MEAMTWRRFIRFLLEATNGIFGTEDDNKVTDRVTRGGDKDSKSGVFEGDGDGKGDAFEDGNNRS